MRVQPLSPTIKIIKVTAGTPVQETDWASAKELSGDILLQNSSALNTSEGEVMTVKNEKGVDVDRKQMPASYTFATSVIRKKGDTTWTTIRTFLNLTNGVSTDLFAIRLIPEDPQAVGFQFLKCTASMTKGWNAEQGALDIISFSGIEPDGTDKEICQDYSASSSSSSGGSSS